MTWFRAAWSGLHPLRLNSIQNQIQLLIALMFTVASLAAMVIAIVNGRRSVDVEMRASVETAESYLRELIRRIQGERTDRDLAALISSEVEHLRHARVYLQRFDRPAMPLPMLRKAASDDDLRGPAPAWFSRLMLPADASSFARIVIVHDGQTTLVVKGDPDDEIEEKWEELRSLALLWLAVMAVLAAGSHLMLGRILGPLSSLSNGLAALEAGERATRVNVSNLAEVGDLARKFNVLAQSLDQARAENGRLYRQIMSVQESERRYVARELHDEAGPCLFSITSNIESIASHAARLPEAEGALIATRTAGVLAAAARLKQLNRALLRRLHPVSLGKVPLAALISELIEDAQRLSPGVRIVPLVELYHPGFGATIDLTIYRCVQEALTNAIHHGRADHVMVCISENDASSTSEDGVLDIQIRDNGSGLKPETQFGFGLSAMRERILAAGGSLKVDADEREHGTIIHAVIPLTAAHTPPQNLTPQTCGEITT